MRKKNLYINKTAPLLMVRFLQLFVPLFLVLLTITSAALYFDAKEHAARRQVSEAAALEIAANRIAQDFSAVISDLHLLVNTPALSRYLDRNNNVTLAELQQNFLVMSREKKLYDQIRYLDENGRERVRVNRQGGISTILPAAELQNKAGRYFFTDTMKLQRGEIFVSPLDLNIEHGKIEIPHKPVIRFGTPVFDSRGHKKGIVLFNYYGSILLDNFHALENREGYRPMLLNREGYWLSSPQTQDEWGFMFNAARTFASAYPQQWKIISTTGQGSISTPEGLFVYTTVYPLDAEHHTSSGSATAAGRSLKTLSGDEYYWKIVSLSPAGLLSDGRVEQYPIVGVIFVVVMLLLVLLSLFLARAWIARQQLRETIAESEARWSFALEGTGDTVWDWNLQTDKVALSMAGAAIFGYAENEIGNNIADWNALLHADDQLRWQDMLRKLFRDKADRFALEYRVRCKDGTYKWVYTRGMVVARSAEGWVLRMIGVHTDTTARKQVEINLQLAASVFSHAREGIIITDANGTIVDANATFTDVTGYSREEALGQNPRMLKSGRQGKEFYAAMWKTIAEQGYWSGEVWNRRKNGEVYAQILTLSAVHDAAGKVQNYVSLFSDITPMKEHQKQLEHIAHYDALTGLANRVLLADRLEQALIRSERSKRALAVVYLDLDGFKAINDRYGHQAGDELLIMVSQRMKAVLREGDTLARIGGDEFVAVLVDLELPHDYVTVIERMLQAAVEPVLYGDAVLKVSASIGVTLYPQDKSDADLLMRHADQAMYIAKQSGKNR